MVRSSQAGLPLEAVNRQPLAEVVADRLLELIQSGHVEVGARLPSEAELGRQLGVGRTSIREGLQRMQTLGFVRVLPGRGAYVCEPTDTQHAFLRYSADHRFAVADVLEVRISLEVLGAGLAALRATASDLRELDEHLQAHRAAHLAADVDALIATDEDFHHCLMKTGRNQVLISRYEDLVPQLREFRARTLALPDVPQRSAGDHTGILDAVRAHDARAASAAVLDHLLVLYLEIEAAASSSTKATRPRASVDLRSIFSHGSSPGRSPRSS